MTIQEMGGSTLLVVSPRDLRDFAEYLMMEASAKLREEEPTYTPAEFAARHRVDKSTLWRWCQQGILKPTKVGRKVVYKDSNLKVKEG